jgi:tetratricopeptide (TPR) repeat protein
VTPSSSPAGRLDSALSFANQVVVFSGRLASLGRKDAFSLVQRLGGEAADEVSSRTTMLVIGADGAGRGASRLAIADASAPGDKSRKLQRAEQVNARTPGQVHIVSEADFCDLGGLPAPEAPGHELYSVREIRELYPAVRDDHLRYLEKWRLIRVVARTNASRYFEFPDLAVIKQVRAELDEGRPFRAIVRTLVSQREGQLAFDFQPGRSSPAHPAKVVALQVQPKPRTADLGQVQPPPMDCQSNLAARYFSEGAGLDEGDVVQQEQEIGAYRQALVLDPTLVPALVNLANLHYARDELVEAQALYERAINLEPECFEAYFNLGNIQHDLGRFGDARECYQAAVQLNPGHADTHFYLAVTLEKLGRSQDARPHWRAYQELAPEGEWVALAKEFSE